MIPDALHPDLRPVVERCLVRFRSWTGRDPEAVACAPGRVNLIGEHTDYNDGFVLPMAINRWCVAAGSLGGRRILSDDLGESVEYDPDHPDPGALWHTPWARYPVGVVWTMRAMLPPTPRRGVEAVIASSVPLGAGLSSSAAVELAIAGLVDCLSDAHLPAHTLAGIGRAAEHEFAGVPCGIMDQLIAASAMPGTAMLIDCRSLECRPVPLPAGASVVIADSGVRHALASGEYAQRRESCRRAAGALGVPSLRDANLAQLEHSRSHLSAPDHACARHVITENARVLRCAAALAAGDLAAAGVCMLESHRSLRDDFRVSCPELDALLEAAMAVPGIFGSRLTGGGFGGCTVTLCTTSARDQLLESLRRTVGRRENVRMEPFVAESVGGAMAWRLAR